MAAILRSGKLLRIVSGFSRTGPNGQQQPQDGSGGTTAQIAIPIDPSAGGSAGGHAAFSSWSFQGLQNALPLISVEPDKPANNNKDDEIHDAIGRRGSDPLLEFYVDKQKIADVTRALTASASSPSLAGLNVVKDNDFSKEDIKTATVEDVLEHLEQKEAPKSKSETEKKTEETNSTTSPTRKKRSSVRVRLNKKKSGEKPQKQQSQSLETITEQEIPPAKEHSETVKERLHVATTCTQTELINENTNIVSTSASSSIQQQTQNEVKIQPEPEVVIQTAVDELQPPPHQLVQGQQQAVGGVAMAVPVNSLPDDAVPMVPIMEGGETQSWYPLPVVCQMFRAQGRIYDLEALLWGSNGIRPDDRKCIYFWTLQSYADSGMFAQAVDLTRRMEAEGLGSDFHEYHSLMNSFAMAVYTTHKAEYDAMTASEMLPPTFDSSSSVVSNSTSIQMEQSLPPTPASEAEEQLGLQAMYHKRIKKSLANGNAVESIEAYRVLEKTGKELNITESSALIELLVKEDLIAEAVAVTDAMLKRSAYPMPKIFRFLLNRLAAKGEVVTMNRMGDHLTPRVKKEVSYDNRLCNAYLAANRGAEYLSNLCQDLDHALAAAGGDLANLDEAELQSLKDKFPRGGAMGLLETNPELLPEYTRLALKFVEVGYIAPVNVLWTYHFINGRHDLAEPLWHAHVKTCPQIMFQKVCQTARLESNADIAQRLVHLLEDAEVTNGARGIAYSCLLDVYTQTKEFGKAVAALREGLASGIRMEDVNRTALKRLKEGMESTGLEFPFDLPKKTNGGEDSVRGMTPNLE